MVSPQRREGAEESGDHGDVCDPCPPSHPWWVSPCCLRSGKPDWPRMARVPRIGETASIGVHTLCRRSSWSLRPWSLASARWSLGSHVAGVPNAIVSASSPERCSQPLCSPQLQVLAFRSVSSSTSTVPTSIGSQRRSKAVLRHQRHSGSVPSRSRWSDAGATAEYPTSPPMRMNQRSMASSVIQAE